MCHKAITQLSSQYLEKARETESLLSQAVASTTQAKICVETGANKDKVNRMVNNDLDLIATMLVVCGLKVVPQDYIYCSKETAEATRELLRNCFNSPDYMRILFK